MIRSDERSRIIKARKAQEQTEADIEVSRQVGHKLGQEILDKVKEEKKDAIEKRIKEIYNDARYLCGDEKNVLIPTLDEQQDPPKFYALDIDILDEKTGRGIRITLRDLDPQTNTAGMEIKGGWTITPFLVNRENPFWEIYFQKTNKHSFPGSLLREGNSELLDTPQRLVSVAANIKRAKEAHQVGQSWLDMLRQRVAEDNRRPEDGADKQ